LINSLVLLVSFLEIKRTELLILKNKIMAKMMLEKKWENVTSAQINWAIGMFVNSHEPDKPFGDTGKTPREICQMIKDKTSFGLNIVTGMINALDRIFGLESSFSE